MTAITPSLFEAFNARYLSPNEVAQTFIPPAHFDRVVQRSHAILTGPRGSGKTTLLKMLQIPALTSWNRPEAARYRKLVDYVTAFIPADESWSRQIDAAFPEEALGPIAQQIRTSVFTTHVLSALLAAVRHSIALSVERNDDLEHLASPLERKQEAELADFLATLWQLQPSFPSFRGLALATQQRLSRLGSLQHRLRPPSDAQELTRSAAFEFLYLDFLTNVAGTVTAINDFTGHTERRFCLAFDGLEIAPPDIRVRLLSALRSTHQSLLFKLSYSPYADEFRVLRHPKGASERDDYLSIELWYSHKEDAEPFCTDLFDAMLSAYDCPRVSPESIMDTSVFDFGRVEEREMGSGYRPGSETYHRFRHLYLKDPSFRRYLDSHGISPSRMHKMRDERRAQYVRKITSVVAVRNEYRAPQDEGGSARRRSRKRPTLYSGASAIFAATEGNPRWFIGIVGPLVRTYSKAKRTVPRGEQIRSLASTANRFRALLNTIPLNVRTSYGGLHSLLALIDIVGEYFHHRVVVDNFEPEPPLAFVVDDEVSSEVAEAVGRALNAGAIVHMPDRPGEPLLGDVYRKRFRLSYLLGGFYRIPLTAGKGRALSRILTRQLEQSEEHQDLLALLKPGGEE